MCTRDVQWWKYVNKIFLKVWTHDIIFIHRVEYFHFRLISVWVFRNLSKRFFLNTQSYAEQNQIR